MKLERLGTVFMVAAYAGGALVVYYLVKKILGLVHPSGESTSAIEIPIDPSIPTGSNATPTGKIDSFDHSMTAGDNVTFDVINPTTEKVSLDVRCTLTHLGGTVGTTPATTEWHQVVDIPPVEAHRVSWTTPGWHFTVYDFVSIDLYVNGKKVDSR